MHNIFIYFISFNSGCTANGSVLGPIATFQLLPFICVFIDWIQMLDRLQFELNSSTISIRWDVGQKLDVFNRKVVFNCARDNDLFVVGRRMAISSLRVRVLIGAADKMQSIFLMNIDFN